VTSETLAFFTKEDTILLNVVLEGKLTKIPIKEMHALSLLRQLCKSLEEQWTNSPRQ
jgi:hypothetical protein